MASENERAGAGSAVGASPTGDGVAADGTAAGGAGADGDSGSTDGARIGGIPSPRPGSPEPSSGPGAKDGHQSGILAGFNGRPADSASTRRKSVVFEEDDELDVPDFLK